MAENGASQTKITALNDYCLESVMKHLSLEDLTNMAVSHPRFAASAAFVYRRKYADQPIRFDSSTSTLAEGEHFLNMLDTFGDSIRILWVNFNTHLIRNARDLAILAQINEKCTKSVVELSVSFVRNDMIFTKPFGHLRKLTIANSVLSASMAQNLAKCAPNLSSIELHNVENVFNETFACHFPSLVHFGKFNETVRNPELELENLQNFRRFVNANQQITSFGVGSVELSYMLKYKLMRQQFFTEMHPDEPCPDRRDLITYLFPFEPIYQQNLKHLHIRLEKNVDFLRVLRHRVTQVSHLPIDHIEVHTEDIPLPVVDLVIQFRELKKLQYYVRNQMHLEMIDHFIKTSLMFPQLLDADLYVLNDKQLFSLDVTLMKAIKVLLEQRDTFRRITIGFEIPRTLAAQGEEGIREYREELRRHYAQHIPIHWRINFRIQTMVIQRQGTEQITLLCFDLTNQSVLHQ